MADTGAGKSESETPFSNEGLKLRCGQPSELDSKNLKRRTYSLSFLTTEKVKVWNTDFGFFNVFGIADIRVLQ